MVPTPNPKSATTVATALSASFVSPALKAAQLQRLAFLCGISKTGTKTELVARLNAAALAATAAATSEQRILSIDLGLRNLAFSLITAKPSSPSPSPFPLHPPRIQLHAWQHRILLERTPTKGAAKEEAKEEEKEGEGEGEEEVDAEAETGISPDLYSPASLARVTMELVRDALLPLRPTHVLIERQRFRSRSHAAVQEWTLRVNSLEAMLHAALRMVREYGLWDTASTSTSSATAGVDVGGGSPEKTTTKKAKGKGKGKKDVEEEKVVTGGSAAAQAGEVISVAPSRVAQFWLEDVAGDMIAAEAGTKATTRKSKAKAKVEAEADALIETNTEEEKEFYIAEEDDEILEEPDPTKKTLKLTSRSKPKPKPKRAKNIDGKGTKRLKIKLLARWLAQDADPKTAVTTFAAAPSPPPVIVTPATPAVATALATYLRRATRGRRRASARPRRGETAAQARAEVDADAALGPKLDDLTDSLLQAMAWLRWEENRLLLARPGGVDRMLLLGGEEEKEKEKGGKRKKKKDEDGDEDGEGKKKKKEGKAKGKGKEKKEEKEGKEKGKGKEEKAEEEKKEKKGRRKTTTITTTRRRAKKVEESKK
ncbi:mitochondrial resolvase Ydc2 [Biscogniauxia mediterranea]|nr:mitochondrial resolvase Ydc2 [Biscogniauxia mediterranea]